MARKRSKGWRKEPARHSLASRGVKFRQAKRPPEHPDLLPGEIYTTKELSDIFGFDLENPPEDVLIEHVTEFWLFEHNSKNIKIGVNPSEMGKAFKKLPMKDDVESALVPAVLSRGKRNEWTWLRVNFDHANRRQDYDVLIDDKFVPFSDDKWSKTKQLAGESIIFQDVLSIHKMLPSKPFEPGSMR